MNSLLGLLRQLAVILLLPGRSFWPYFAGAAILILALLRIGWAEAVRVRSGDKAIALGRAFFAIPMAVFGADHFISPGLIATLVPCWIPWHLFLAHMIGAALVAASLGMLFHRKARIAAIWLGIFVFAIVLFVYLPIAVSNLSDVANGLNYLGDTLAFSGTALLLAGALPVADCSEAISEERKERAARAGASA